MILLGFFQSPKTNPTPLKSLASECMICELMTKKFSKSKLSQVQQKFELNLFSAIQLEISLKESNVLSVIKMKKDFLCV